eukprot:TRINITY_DN12460_c0_g1_i1.p1 TRINITY_DN12460_c0_g1~~TRINITY_DN12460_c0_g1_i1.p1  ORF type:complete len:361 (+),score=64.72 TRINITY_DN12460_c0_g1_i1:930-2012(+)
MKLKSVGPSAGPRWIWSVSLDLTTNRLVGGSLDGSISVFDFETGASLDVLSHDGSSRVYGAKIVGNYIASGSKSGVVKLWDQRLIGSGRTKTSTDDSDTKTCCVRTFEYDRVKNDHPVRCLDFDGNTIVTGSYSNNIKIWDIRNVGSCVKTIECKSIISSIQFDAYKIVYGTVCKVEIRETNEGKLLHSIPTVTPRREKKLGPEAGTHQMVCLQYDETKLVCSAWSPRPFIDKAAVLVYDFTGSKKREKKSGLGSSISGFKKKHKKDLDGRESDDDDVDIVDDGDDDIEKKETDRNKSRGSDKEWNCTSCTFLNSANSLKCDMCDSKKPKKSEKEWSCKACTFVNPAFEIVRCQICQTAK